MGNHRRRHRYVIWRIDGDIGKSHGGIKDDDLDMLYGDSKMATYVCCIRIQRWRHRCVIWGFKDGEIGMSYERIKDGDIGMSYGG